MRRNVGKSREGPESDGYEMLHGRKRAAKAGSTGRRCDVRRQPARQRFGSCAIKCRRGRRVVSRVRRFAGSQVRRGGEDWEEAAKK